MPSAIVRESDVKAAKEQAARLFDRGKRLKQDWVEFFLDLRDFQEAVVNGHQRKYELAGYDTWDEFFVKLCKELDESRSEMYAKLTAVKLLPATTIRKLGKTKAFVAARMKKAGKLTPQRLERLEKMSTEEAKAEGKKVCAPVEERMRRLGPFTVPETQYELWNDQEKRFRKNTGCKMTVDFVDFLLGQFTSLTDKQIEDEWEGMEVKRG